MNLGQNNNFQTTFLAVVQSYTDYSLSQLRERHYRRETIRLPD
jgi:hypothetical protein